MMSGPSPTPSLYRGAGGVGATYKLLWDPSVTEAVHGHGNETPKFLLGTGNDLKLYRYTQSVSKSQSDGQVQLLAVGSSTELTHMKCFAWCPHPQFNDILAIGFANGRTALTSLRGFTWLDSGNGLTHNTQQGHTSHHPTTNDTYLASSAIPTGNRPFLAEFTPKHTRAVTAVSFCPTHPELLCTGLDKVRNDNCLLVWDIKDALLSTSTTSSNKPSPSTGNRSTFAPSAVLGGQYATQYTKEIRESTSWGIWGSSPGTSLRDWNNANSTGVSRGTDDQMKPKQSKPIAQYGTSEAVTSASWFHSERPRVIAGMGGKWIRVYDLRVDPSSPPSHVIATKHIHSISCDPFHPHRFLSSSLDDNTIKVWDIRSTSDPLITLKHDLRGVDGVQWSFGRSGVIGAFGGNVVKIWDLMETTEPDTNTNTSTGANEGIQKEEDGEMTPTMRRYRLQSEASTISLGGMQLPSSLSSFNSSHLRELSTDRYLFGKEFGTSPTNEHEETPNSLAVLSRSVKTDSSVESTHLKNASTSISASNLDPVPTSPAPYVLSSILTQPNRMNQEEPIASTKRVPMLFKSRTIRPSQRPIMSFGFVPVNPDETSRVLTVYHETQFVVTKIMDAPVINWSSRGEMGMTVQRREVWLLKSPASPHQVLGSDKIWMDIGGVMRRRGGEGYGLDIQKNIQVLKHEEQALLGSDLQNSRYSVNIMTNNEQVNELLTQNRNLQRMWAWVAQVYSLGETSLKVGNRSYRWCGVHSVISNLAAELKRNSLDFPTVTHSSLNSPFKTYMNQYRKIALLICGWNYNDRSFEETLRTFESRGEHVKAAGWAMFHGNHLGRAITALNASKEERLRLVAAALAAFVPASTFAKQGGATGYSPSTTTTTTATSTAVQLNYGKMWVDMCHHLSSDMDDPYLRSMFAVIGNQGDFSSVLHNEELSLMDRVGVALRFLSDEELIPFITNVTKQHIADASMEGVLLTGLSTPQGMELFENFVHRTMDIQSAACMFSVCVAPRGTSATGVEERATEWVENYRILLDRWQLHHQRAKFDIVRRKVYAAAMNHPASRNQQGTFPPSNTSSVPSPIAPSAGLAGTLSPASQVFVRCNFCNANISRLTSVTSPVAGNTSQVSQSPASATTTGFGGSSVGTTSSLNSISNIKKPGLGSDAVTTISSPGGTNAVVAAGVGTKSKMTSCPSCRKPLPRCSICLLRLGETPESPLLSSSRRRGGSEIQAKPSVNQGVDTWFAWCQSCRHGGHAGHLLEWFQTHDYCPVTGCQCRCRI